MKKLITIALLLFITATSFAQTFTVNGLNYQVISTNPNKVQVTGGSPSTNLVIPETVTNNGTDFTVTRINSLALRNKGIASVTLPETIETIGFEAFRNNNLSTIDIPDSVTGIEANAFRNNNLVTITIGTGITNIGNDAFNENAPLIEVTANALTPSGLGNAAAFNNRNGVRLIVSESSLSAYQGNANWNGFFAINGTYDLPANRDFTRNGITYRTRATGSNTVNIQGSNSGQVNSTLNLGEVVINSILFSVVAIKQDALKNRGITSITIGSTIESIESAAFRDNNLTQVEIPDNVTNLGSSAFSSNNLMEIIIPNSVTSISIGTFSSNALTSVTIPTSVTSIGRGAFNVNNLTSVIIPDSVTSIGEIAFRSNNLTTVVVEATQPPGIVNGDGLFNDSFGTDRPNIDLFVPIGTRDAYLSAGWTGFKSITEGFVAGTFTYIITASSPGPNEVRITGGINIPSDIVIPATVTNGTDSFTVTSIGNRAFRENGLTSVNIPNSVTSIGFEAFRDNGLESVTIPNSVISIDDLAFTRNSLTSVTIPDSVTSIGNNVFSNNDLTSVTIPTSVTSIGEDAFNSNDLTSVTIPDSVTSIDEGAFRSNSLTTVVVEATVPPGISTGGGILDSFGTDRPNIDLFVPVGSLDAYEDPSNGWTGFKSVTNPKTAPYTEDFESFTTGTGAFVSENGWTANPGGFFWEVAAPTDTSSDNTGPAPSVNTGNYFLLETSDGSNGDIIDLVSPPVDLSGLSNPGLSFNYHMFGNTMGTLEVLVNDTDTVFSLSGQQQTSETEAYSIADINLSAYAGQTISVTFRGVRGNEFRSDIAIDNVVFDDISCFAPSDLGVTNVTTNQAELFWTENGSATSYDIEFVDLTAGEAPIGIPTTTGITNTTFTVTALLEDNAYTFFVRADCGAEGTSNWAGPFNFQTPIQNCDTVFLDSGGISGNYANDEFTSTTFIPETTGQAVSITFTYVDIEVSDDGCFDALTIYNGPDNTFPVLAQSVCSEVSGDGDVPPASNLLSIGDTFTSTDPSGALTIEFKSDNVEIRTGWEATVTCVGGSNAFVSVAPKVFLQGASLNPIAGEESLMRDDLRTADLLPITSPYGDGATVDPTVFNTTGASAIVDWVLVELREGTDNENTTVLVSISAFLQRDGDIVGLDGTSAITFTAPDGDYFIAIKHRNHIGVMTAVPTALSSTVTSLDFTQDAAFANGENLALTTLDNGNLAMIAGDADGSGQILNIDVIEGLTLAGGGEAYSTADADMNGFVLNSDIQILILGNSGSIQQFD